MTKRNISIAEIIKKIFKENNDIDYYTLLKKVKEMYEKENTTSTPTMLHKKNKKESEPFIREEPILFIEKDTSEFNNRLREFIAKKQIGYYFDLDFEFSDYTSFKTDVPKEKVLCHLFWIDNSVHSIILDKIMKVIKNDFYRNIIKLTKNTENTREYSFSEIEVINNNANVFNIYFYEFKQKYKNKALEKFEKESTYSYEIPYKLWDKDDINKDYNLNINCDIKAYMLYPMDSKCNWAETHFFECIKVFIRVNNYYIVFQIKEDRLEYIIKLINKILLEISKK